MKLIHNHGHNLAVCVEYLKSAAFSFDPPPLSISGKRSHECLEVVTGGEETGLRG